MERGDEKEFWQSHLGGRFLSLPHLFRDFDLDMGSALVFVASKADLWKECRPIYAFAIRKNDFCLLRLVLFFDLTPNRVSILDLSPQRCIWSGRLNKTNGFMARSKKSHRTICTASAWDSRSNFCIYPPNKSGFSWDLHLSQISWPL